MSKNKRVAHNATPCTWNGLPFTSFEDLGRHLGLGYGYVRSYWIKHINLKGHPIITKIPAPAYSPKTNRRKGKRWSNTKMIDFARYCTARKNQVSEIGYAGMLKNFEILVNRK